MSITEFIDLHVETDWTGSGFFDGANDDITDDVVADPGVDAAVGRDTARQFSPPMINESQWEVYNDEGEYSNERASADLYQQVLPGRDTRITADHGDPVLYRTHQLYRSHIPYRGRYHAEIHRGLLNSIRQTVDIGDRRVRFRSLGKMARLQKGAITIALQSNIRVDEAITLVLDAVGWPEEERSIGIADTTLLYWWVEERSPWDVLMELLESEGPGLIWEDGAGVFHFEGRNFRVTNPASETSQAIFYPVIPTTSQLYRSHTLYRSHRFYRGGLSGMYFTALSYDPGFDSVINRCTYTTRRRTIQSSAQVWEYGSTISLNPSQIITLIAKPQDPFINAITPVEGNDFSVTPALGVTVTLTYSSGNVAFIQLQAGGSGATISGVTSNGIRMRAQALTSTSETVIPNTVDASASITKYKGTYTKQVQGWPEVDPATAQAVCDSWVRRYMEARPQVTIELRNGSVDMTRNILQLKPSDRITLVEPNSGISGDVWVEKKRVVVRGAGGRDISAVLECERSEGIQGAVWDSDLWDDAEALWGE